MNAVYTIPAKSRKLQLEISYLRLSNDASCDTVVLVDEWPCVIAEGLVVVYTVHLWQI